MRVEYDNGLRTTQRIRVDLEPHEAEALADLYASIFDDGKADAISTGLRKIAVEWRLDGQLALGSADAAEKMACPTENAPATRERSGAEPRSRALTTTDLSGTTRPNNRQTGAPR